jgi:hypothetical protein
MKKRNEEPKMKMKQDEKVILRFFEVIILTRI